MNGTLNRRDLLKRATAGAAMLALPPVAPDIGWRTSTRLPRDHYIRFDGNDYSVQAR